MIHAIKERVRIKPGGVIEISHPELPPGEEAEVIVMLDAPAEKAPASSAQPPTRPIWEVAMELGAAVPESDWAKVPRDLAKNLDHYLYGTPK